jgi:ATP-dependent helicase/nuclease subunit A
MQKTFHIYKSSAGSGKTYTLVKEYLKLVLQHPARVRNILAITFTNAAAAEMKSRILEELSAINDLKKNPGNEKARRLVQEIMKEAGKEQGQGGALQEQTLIDNAGTVLQFILHNYGIFR